jgi:hypothetical protein
MEHVLRVTGNSLSLVYCDFYAEESCGFRLDKFKGDAKDTFGHLL